MFEKNTPRDFFIHIGAFATLYFAAIALITLLFQVINYAFPDELRGYYYYQDPYSASMRFAIASLIVLTPIFIYLMRVVQREARKDPERRTIGVRKWLTYITLFVAGATIIGDLIALLNTFLGGTLATPFLLKVLALFVVVGAGFVYFFLDIKGYWVKNEKQSKLAGLGVGVLVIASIVGGFLIIGTPGEQRELRLDNQQVQDLQMIQSQVVQYWQQNETLPSSLSAIESDVTGFAVPTAPEGRSAYAYTQTGDLSFELCATFVASSDADRSMAAEAYGLRGSTNWQHDAGEHCFERTIDPNIIQPFGKPIPAQ